jgi:hypothetical protein
MQSRKRSVKFRCIGTLITFAEEKGIDMCTDSVFITFLHRQENVSAQNPSKEMREGEQRGETVL